MTLTQIITLPLLSKYNEKIQAWVKALKATTEADGIMSKEDKAKLDGIEAGSQVNVIETVKVDGTALTPDANKAVNIDLSGKADKVTSATAGNFAGLDANGNLTDSGSKAADFATAAQGEKADSALQTVSASGSGFVSASFAAKANNAQALTVGLTTHAVASAAVETDGLATALDVKNYIASMVSAGINYRGSVNRYSDLPTTNLKGGDMYNVKNDEGTPGTANFYPGDMNYVYVEADAEKGISAGWDPQSPVINLVAATEADINGLFA